MAYRDDVKCAQAGAVYGQAKDPFASGAIVVPPVEPFLHEALKLVEDAAERAGILKDRLVRIEARVFGDRGEDAAGKDVKPTPCGSAGALRERLNELLAILRSTSPVVDRLDNIG